MNSTAGKAPLHRRYSEENAKMHVRNRYSGLRKVIALQVEALQSDPGFRKTCEAYYAHGLPDWVIISAIYNLMLTTVAQAMGIALNDPKSSKSLADIKKKIPSTTLSAADFADNKLDPYIAVFHVTCLQTYGFQLRRPDVSPDTVEKFLRERMRHFDYDEPHGRLFADPPGQWPDL